MQKADARTTAKTIARVVLSGSGRSSFVAPNQRPGLAEEREHSRDENYYEREAKNCPTNARGARNRDNKSKDCPCRNIIDRRAGCGSRAQRRAEKVAILQDSTSTGKAVMLIPMPIKRANEVNEAPGWANGW